MLTVGVLGPVEVRRDGDVVDVPAGKTSELLVRLALDPGRHLRAEALLEELWDEPAGRNTLQSKVSQLRKALGDRDVVAAAYDGYALVVDPRAVDATRAAELAASSAAARSAGDAAGSLDAAAEGLGLFRGDPLPGAGDWAAAHRARLEELRLGLLEDLLAARVALGSGGDVIAELETQVAAHPWREGLWVSLVTALYRAGRQADALAAYGRVRATLVDDLGIEPGAELQALVQQVLRQDPALGGPAAAPAGPGNLPPRGSPLLGRDLDLTTVARHLGAHRVVTVLGRAGVGKTRLAIEVARGVTVPGGTWLVRLDAVDGATTSEDLARVVAETLHVPGGAASLAARLAGATTLLVLDNIEHVAQQAAGLVRALLDDVPTLRVLATGQTGLGLEEERGHWLDALGPEDSFGLFVRRAGELRPGFALDDETAAEVVEVCGALEGLPLAIELAASRVRSMSVRDLGRRLDDRFALLRDPTSRRPQRQRTLEGAIGWSYDLLFPDDQRALWALSCFAAGARLDAAEHVLAALDVPPAVALDSLGRLVDRSLVYLEPTPDGEVRYRTLDSIRTYAAGAAAEAGERARAARAHAEWYAARAAWCEEHVRGPDQPACLDLVRAERSDVDDALAWTAYAEPALGVRIALGLGWTWVVLGDGTAGAARLRGVLTPDTDVRDRAEVLLLAGWLEASAGDVAAAQADLDAANEAAAGVGDEVLLGDVERHRAFLAIQQGRPDRVLVHAAAALSVSRERGLTWRTAGALLLAAYGALMVGNTAAATRDASEALGLLQPLGDSWGIVHAEAMLGGIAQAEHRFADAAAALERAADESVAMGFLGQAALHRATLGRVQQRLGDPAAPATYARAIDDAVACADGRLAATARLQLARLRRGLGDLEGARALLEEDDRWYGEAGGGDYALLAAATLAAVRDDSDALAAALEAARADGLVEVQVVALDGLARLAAVAGDRPRAGGLLADADALAPQVAHTLDDADRHDAATARALLAEGR